LNPGIKVEHLLSFTYTKMAVMVLVWETPTERVMAGLTLLYTGWMLTAF